MFKKESSGRPLITLTTKLCVSWLKPRLLQVSCVCWMMCVPQCMQYQRVLMRSFWEWVVTWLYKAWDIVNPNILYSCICTTHNTCQCNKVDFILRDNSFTSETPKFCRNPPALPVIQCWVCHSSLCRQSKYNICLHSVFLDLFHEVEPI